jgi:phage shock protein PspC (stress-responsive transcriptional regulator)
MTKRLYRSRNDRKLWGVCGGLGKYFDIDPVIFRIVFVVTIFFGLAGLLVYIIMTLIVPLEPENTTP